MEQIRLSKEDLNLLEEKYPGLTYTETDNKIKGVLSFYRSYNEKPVKGKYSIEFKLEYSSNSILPKVRETEGKILNIARRKKLPSFADIHLNNLNGELCLIFPIKEKMFYPNGFELKRFLNHLEEHFYWVTYFDRYDKKPWKDEPHNGEEALIKAVKENKFYRKDLQAYIEAKGKRKYSRQEFRRFLKANKLL